MMALAAMPQITNALEHRMNSIFRSDNPTDILNGYVQLLRNPRAPRQQNEAMADLAVRDPVALWIAVATVLPEPFDPAARAEQMIALAEEQWGLITERDKDRIRSLCIAASENLLDGNAAAVALAESQDVWFTANGFFDQIEAISANLPPSPITDSFEAWTGWRIPVSQIALALGYEGRTIPAPESGEADAAMVTPYLFDREVSADLAARFEQSPVNDSLLMAWLYLPNFEVYLAYGALPETLPAADASPRLAAAYQAINDRQMAAFEAQEMEMMQ